MVPRIIDIVHFHNGTGGGVLSVIDNLAKFSNNGNIRNHIIFTINGKYNKEFNVPKLRGVFSVKVFYYFANWNFYFTCKRLAKLLPDDKAVIVAHDWLELGMVSNLGLQNPVVQVVHGNYNYYYDLAKKHDQIIDRFIAVSPVIYKNLCFSQSHRKTDIDYLRFPVPSLVRREEQHQILRIFYSAGNLDDENKQFRMLPLINQKLILKGITIHWTIVGVGKRQEEVEKEMYQGERIEYFPCCTNAEILKLLQRQDLFLLPSIKEGFPVSIVEAMKVGVVPLVTNWEGATEELVEEGKTGFYFEIGDVDRYVEKISYLDTNRTLLNQLSGKGAERANVLFDPYENTKKIEKIFLDVHTSEKSQKEGSKVYGSRLDKKWIPNWATAFIRSITNVI